jgi:hypothetical protein
MLASYYVMESGDFRQDRRGALPVATGAGIGERRYVPVISPRHNRGNRAFARDRCIQLVALRHPGIWPTPHRLVQR